MSAVVIELGACSTLAEASTAFLDHRDLDADTVRSYAQTMTRLRGALGDSAMVADLTPGRIAEVFTAAWDGAEARTWNRHRSAMRSFTAWPAGPGRGWITADLAALVERRRETTGRTRAMSRAAIEAL